MTPEFAEQFAFWLFMTLIVGFAVVDLWQRWRK